MREIKFRAWDDIKKLMILWGDMLKHKGIMWSVLAGTKITRHEHQYDEEGVTSLLFIPMQFTGLHDKNGKEIYEGDITKCSFGKHFWISEIKSVGGQFGNNLFAVEIKNNLCHDMGTGIYNYEISTENAGRRNDIQGGKDVEVIGNIYQNPELLK